MSPDVQMVLAQLDKARQKLDAAKTLLAGGYFDDALSRAYYAMYHPAAALLLTEGLTADTHSRLKTLFGLRFVQSGTVDRKYARMLTALKDEREAGDYDLFTAFDEDDARRGIEQAEDFIQAIGDLARRRVAGRD